MRVSFRRAVREDLPAIVALLADDDINGFRERAGEPLAEGYVTAFDALDGDPNNILIVGERDGAIVATAQLTFIPTLTQQGATRAIIESVRVASGVRSQGVGEQLIAHLTDIARERNCPAVQLTTSKPRTAAQRFYARIGFAHSHFGYKRELK
jgi:ribosomal protein S18 acetylase RimI-like enzyme